MTEGPRKKLPSAVEFGSLKDLARGLLARAPAASRPASAPRSAAGTTILPPAPPGYSEPRRASASGSHRPSMAAHATGVPWNQLEELTTLRPVAYASERARSSETAEGATPHEPNVFFVRRRGKLQFDWVLAFVLVVTGSVVGFAGQRAAEHASDSVASARRWICQTADAPAPAAHLTDMAATQVVLPDVAPPPVPQHAPIELRPPLARAPEATFTRPARSAPSDEGVRSRSPLQSAMEGAAGISGAHTEARNADRAEPPADDNSALPETPAVGALQSVVHPLLTAARGCIRAQTDPSHVNIVFASTGHVSDVVVTGPAAGTPAERCMRSAFATASVAPFRKSKYVVGIAVRP